ncbi:MAG: YraN family protein [Saprospiraceae bacterium]|nr:YraN family protein [Bacteroidia bacterium]MBT8228893.1 YraN family protein [Bacteroidia bacterium]NNF23080.1 YraN family protein [Saprospiraceae bacterium]
MLSNTELGQLGEQQAISFLTQHQYAIIERNWRYNRAEIDIIARLGSILVFVEVKSRMSTYFEDAEISVDQKKEALLIDAAQRFMEQIGHNGELRFDIISVYFNKKYQLKKINHFIDAFFY